MAAVVRPVWVCVDVCGPLLASLHTDKLALRLKLMHNLGASREHSMNRRECFPSFAARSCDIPHISDPKRIFFPLYLLLFVALAMMMQNNQDAAPRACTAIDTASGEAIA